MDSLGASAQLAGALLSLSGNGAFLANQDGSIVYCNDAAKRLLVVPLDQSTWLDVLQVR